MDASKELLLVVEDVPDTLKLVELTLTFKGYRVVTATNGQEALKAIEEERPSLIITDILMPRMDGFTLVHRLRVRPETRDLPVIFLSATYVAPEDKDFAAAIGVSQFIEKPIDIEELLSTVKELLSQSAPGAHEPLDERAFYEGYRKRLETKLRQKTSQILRIEGMLNTLSPAEKQSFQISLQEAIDEQNEIQHLLGQIRDQLDGNANSE
jgi:CheY-like chemotaxis protein